MDLSIILPAFNEEKVIQSTIKKIIDYFRNLDFEYEIIVIDDGSKDKTATVVTELNIANLSLIKHEKNLGKGAAVKSGVFVSTGDHLLFLDADYSTSIDNFGRFFQKIKQESSDIVIASRALNDSVVEIHQSKFKEILGKFGNKLIKLALVKGINDTQCGFKLFTKECKKIFAKQKVLGFGFDFEILFLAQKYGYKISQVPVVWTDMPDSDVKFKSYLKTFLDLFLVKYNDLLNKY